MNHGVGMLLWWFVGLAGVAAFAWLAWIYLRAQSAEIVDHDARKDTKPPTKSANTP